MPVLHMETTAVRSTGQQLNQLSQSLEHQISRLSQATNRLDSTWDGMSAHQFMGDIRPLLQRLRQVSHAGIELSQRVEQEVQEWEEVANRLGDSTTISFGGLVGAMIGNSISNIVAPFLNLLQPSVDYEIQTPSVNIDESIYEPIDTDSSIPLYELNIDNLDDFDPAKALDGLDTGGRPIMFLVHGYNTPDADYKDAAQAFNEQYGRLPEHQRPVLVGIEWDSGGVSNKTKVGGAGTVLTASGLAAAATYESAKEDYRAANANAVDTGKKFGDLLEGYSKRYPERGVNVMTHSLGTRMVMEAVQDDDVRIDNFLAVQGATDVDAISHEGQFSDMTNSSEVENFGATYSRSVLHGDRVLRLGHESVYGSALGRAADHIEDRPVTLYDLGGHGDGFKNHYNINNDSILQEVVPDFFPIDEHDPFGREIIQDPVLEYGNQAYA